MPLLTDLEDVRARLLSDPAWAVYALGDLAPGFSSYCQWLEPPSGPPALALLYREFDIPILWLMGDAPQLDELVAELPDEPKLRLQIQPQAISPLKRRFELPRLDPMFRMVLDPDRLPEPPREQIERLSPRDLAQLQALYAEGYALGQGPEFFFPSMLDWGVFYGAFDEDSNLIAVAGTHLVAPTEGVAAIGSIYTHSAHRRRGWAARLTAVLSLDLLDLGVETIALSVHQENTAAIHVYERLGFRRHCPFYEGLALKPKP